jgi:hypothetical protein
MPAPVDLLRPTAGAKKRYITMRLRKDGRAGAGHHLRVFKPLESTT